MWIKKSHNSPSSLGVAILFIKTIKIKFFVSVLIILGLLFASTLSGIYYGTTLMGSHYGSIFASFYRYFRPSLAMVNNTISGLFSNPENIYIDMKHIDYEKLSHQVFNANHRGTISDLEKQVEVNATIRYRDSAFDGKLRLRGSYLEHVRGDKWSFRIKLKNDETINGMNRFSLSSPELRNHIHEWIFQENLKYEELISLRYDFVNVSLNGKSLGIYALEEFFDKRLIENNQLREGILLRPDDLDSEGVPFIYQSSKIRKDQEGENKIEALKSRIIKYRNMEETGKELYDIQKSAKYFAITTIFGGQHGHLKEN